MKLRCLMGHDWVVGKIARAEAVEMLRPLRVKLFQNRHCMRCGRTELHANDAEVEYFRRMEIKKELTDSLSLDDEDIGQDFC